MSSMNRARLTRAAVNNLTAALNISYMLFGKENPLSDLIRQAISQAYWQADVSPFVDEEMPETD